ncbi:MAG: FliA/WhiG family RNA polymerase sigma factor [Deltaproteobacteria bacterium]|nr:FliA/WhiG family RNA polymerase sigma factor [Deltaproteobacteria bacterium]
MTRDEACDRYHNKVLLLARRVYERLSPEAGVQLEDMVSYGAIGLLEAFDRYDESRGIQFSTFAEYRIRGAMYDALRTQDTFTRRRRQLAKKVEAATDHVRDRQGRDPLPEEIAEELGVSLDEYWMMLDRVKPVSHVSLDAPQGDEEEGRPLIERLISQSSPGPDTRVAVQQIRTKLKASIRELPDKERQCVMMYYGKDLSMAEIAAVYGVTVSRVSQILTAARGSLRKKLANFIDESDLDLSDEP